MFMLLSHIGGVLLIYLELKSAAADQSKQLGTMLCVQPIQELELQKQAGEQVRSPGK